MSFEKMISVVLSWPVLFLVFAVVMAVFGWRKYRLSERARKIVVNVSERTYIVISVAFGLIFAVRVMVEYGPEFYRFFDQFTRGTGIDASWFIAIVGLMIAALVAMILFGISEGTASVKGGYLSTRLARIKRYDEYDRELAAEAAKGLFGEDCVARQFTWTEDGNIRFTKQISPED